LTLARRGQYTPFMRIGDIELEAPFLLAPLAGQTDSPMRRVCRRRGASMVWTEMVSAEGVVRDGAKSFELLAFGDEERPIAFQLFGSRPESMAGAAAATAGLNPDVIDINAGCPARKVVRSGSGAALMREPALLREIVSAVVESAGRPVTAKIRSGWDADSLNAVEIASDVEGCGAAAVAVHPRTRAQGFKGSADWDVIRDVKSAVGIPVIGSGDVRTPWDALAMLEETGCDGVMIGRGAVGNPWIFGQARALMATGKVPPGPPLSEVLSTAIEQLDLMVECKGERRGVFEMRKHLVAYLRGFDGASKLRAELVRIEDHTSVRERLKRAGVELCE
jgi:tRNA-dihydrouridine synthase B